MVESKTRKKRRSTSLLFCNFQENDDPVVPIRLIIIQIDNMNVCSSLYHREITASTKVLFLCFPF